MPTAAPSSATSSTSTISWRPFFAPSTIPPPALQHLHGRAGRLRRARRLPARDLRAALGPRRDAVSLDLARQHQGEVLARLAPPVRSETDGRRGLGLPAGGQRSSKGVVPR